MKRIVAIILALAALCTSCKRDDIAFDGGGTLPVGNDDPDIVNWAGAVDYVFDEDVIPQIHVSVSQAEWDRLLEAFDDNPDTKEFIKCDVKYIKGKETTVIKSAGLRLKGNTSRRRPQFDDSFSHVHFGLDFHHYVKDPAHTVKGLRRVDLKWFKDDPAYAREIYCYDLFRREGVWTAVRDVYCRLWLKVGKEKEMYYGVYGMLEHIDKNYLRVREKEFGTHEGNLWKCFWSSSLTDTGARMGVDADNTGGFVYELKTNKEEGEALAIGQLRDFIKNLNNLSGDGFNSWISSHMDVDLFLKTLAVNVAVGMWDDYWNNSNNYYLYFDAPADKENYKVWFIPYDYDNTLGTTQECGRQSDAGRQNPLKWGHSSYPLTNKILQNPAWRNAYVKYLKELCAGDFSAQASMARIRGWQSRISPYVSNDTGEDMTIEDRPAPWSNHPEYRLLESGSNNFFEVKASAVNTL